jgi:phospholipid transport system substrate-binding protein
MTLFKNMTAILASLVLCTGLAHAADETPDALIKRISQEVLDVAKTDKDIQAGDQQKVLALVETKILPYVDFQHMTELAAARNWRAATPDQQTELVKQFKTLLIYTYSGALSQVKDQRLEYKPFRADPQDTDVEVRSQVITPRAGQVIELNYRLAKGADGWKIYDINVLGAWLIETYKGNFSAEISKSGIDGLIKALADKNAKLAKNYAKKST